VAGGLSVGLEGEAVGEKWDQKQGGENGLKISRMRKSTSDVCLGGGGWGEPTAKWSYRRGCSCWERCNRRVPLRWDENGLRRANQNLGRGGGRTIHKRDSAWWRDSGASETGRTPKTKNHQSGWVSGPRDSQTFRTTVEMKPKIYPESKRKCTPKTLDLCY